MVRVVVERRLKVKDGEDVGGGEVEDVGGLLDRGGVQEEVEEGQQA